MNWENLFHKASDGLENFREKNIQINERVTMMSDDQLIKSYKNGISDTILKVRVRNEIEERGIKYRLRER